MAQGSLTAAILGSIELDALPRRMGIKVIQQDSATMVNIDHSMAEDIEV